MPPQILRSADVHVASETAGKAFVVTEIFAWAEARDYYSCFCGTTEQLAEKVFVETDVFAAAKAGH